LIAGKDKVVRDLEALLFGRDPIGIDFEVNTNEHCPEAERITPASQRHRSRRWSP
jgi:hypothetical protein